MNEPQPVPARVYRHAALVVMRGSLYLSSRAGDPPRWTTDFSRATRFGTRDHAQTVANVVLGRVERVSV